MALAGLLSLVFGLAQLAQGWVAVQRAQAWPVVEGQVVEARLDSGRDRMARWGEGWQYQPVVVFRYAVKGEGHKGRQAWLGAQPVFTDEPAARAVLADWPKGALVEVRHDPADPARAALVLQVDWMRGMLWWLGGGVFLFLGLCTAAIARTPR